MKPETKLVDLIEQVYTPDEKVFVVYCDDGNGSSFPEGGQTIEYDPTKHANITMMVTSSHMSADHVECMWESKWIEGENGYRWKLRF